jgi:excisionase family DNA binding protein
MEYLTAMEAAVYAHKSEKTIRLWIAQGKLPAEKVAVKGLNQWAIDKRDIDALLSTGKPTTGIASDTIRDITGSISGHDALIAELKNKTDELQRQIDELKTQIEQLTELASQPPTPAPVAQTQPHQTRTTHTPVSSGLPDGLIAFRQFAKDHGISETTAKRAIDSGSIGATEGAWKVDRVIIKRAFNAKQQRDFVKAYQTQASFHQCTREDCPCHK